MANRASPAECIRREIGDLDRLAAEVAKNLTDMKLDALMEETVREMKKDIVREHLKDRC